MTCVLSIIHFLSLILNLTLEFRSSPRFCSADRLPLVHRSRWHLPSACVTKLLFSLIYIQSIFRLVPTCLLRACFGLLYLYNYMGDCSPFDMCRYLHLIAGDILKTLIFFYRNQYSYSSHFFGSYHVPEFKVKLLQPDCRLLCINLTNLPILFVS